MVDRHFGDVQGVRVGRVFESRKLLAAAGIHKPTMAGISGGSVEGADSIVMSGGYIDDEDYGDWILYTGDGGNDTATGRQIANQDLTGRNLALAISADRGLPVRVTRGSKLDSDFAPESGYRYDGLYFIEDYFSDVGRDGFKIQRYRLRQQPNQPTVVAQATTKVKAVNKPAGVAKPKSVKTTVQRIVRSTTTANWVKTTHDYRCQFCSTRLETAAGGYAEGAHIRALGSPHNGADVAENILCLCPNCHVIFDRYAVYIDEDWTLRNSSDGSERGKVVKHPEHELSLDAVSYHRGLRIGQS